MPIPDFQDVVLQTYNKELAERETIFNRTNLHITISLALITAITYIASRLDAEGSNPIQLVTIYILIAIGATLIFISLFFTRKALTDYQYRELPKIQEILHYYDQSLEYRNSIALYNQQNATSLEAQDPQDATNRLVLDSLAQATDRNHTINQERRNHLQKSLRFILASVPVLIGVGVIFVTFDMDTSSPRKDNGTYDKRLTAAVNALNHTIQSGRFPQN